jgi:hypothetical protein
MARQMKTVHAPKREDNVMTLEAPKGRGFMPPPSCKHKDKRRRNRASERVSLRKGED